MRALTRPNGHAGLRPHSCRYTASYITEGAIVDIDKYIQHVSCSLFCFELCGVWQMLLCCETNVPNVLYHGVIVVRGVLGFWESANGGKIKLH